jgi:hypothetical protein
MFAHVGIKAEHGEVFVRVNAVLMQEVERKDGGMRRVTTRQRKPLSFEILKGAYRRICLGDKDRGKPDIGVPHRQHLTLPAELFLGLEIGQRGVPRDIDLPIHQRLH